MNNTEIKLSQFICETRSGDWGKEEIAEGLTKVRCFRGADIKSLNLNDITSAPIRYVKRKSITDKSLMHGNIIIEISGGSPTQSTGRTALITEKIYKSSDIPLLCSNFCRYLIVKEEYDPTYVYYTLNNIYKLGYFFNFEGKTSGIKNLILNVAFDNIIVFDYNKEIQIKISKVLSDLDAKLEAMAKVIYNYWFVQFDFPDENGKPYKTQGGKMIFNENLKREIPAGWEGKRIDEVLNTELGGTPSTKIEEYWDGEFPWLNSGEIANFPIIESELKVTDAGISNSATTLMPKGTCVLSITRHLRPSILGVNSCANQSVVGLFESNQLKSSYIYPYLVNEIPRLMSLRTGAQQPHINKGIVDESLILVPEESVLNNYYASVNSMYDKIINNAFQNQKLAELRDWLLPMLMNGQVRVN
jgi:hypothetical protein